MSGGKCINSFYTRYFRTSEVSFYGLEAIRTNFVGQPNERATDQYVYVLCFVLFFTFYLTS